MNRLRGPNRSSKCPGGCSKLVHDRAYYMVHDHIWVQAGFTTGRACLDCLSRRLGRKLTPEDFTDAPVNEPIFDVLRNVIGSRPSIYSRDTENPP